MSLILLNGLIASPAAIAEERIPIPSRRPDVMSVSPAYIEELRNREKQQVSPPISEHHVLQSTSQGMILDEDGMTTLATIDGADLFNILAPISIATVLIPTPPHKPSLNEMIEPTAQEEDQETTLVSFTLKAKQVSLDKNLRFFLEKHAVRILNENKKLEIQIHAYATPIEGEAYSDVRISLARALEVRSFLIDKNIEASRLKLTPLGHNGKNNSNDRIDLIFIDRKE